MKKPSHATPLNAALFKKMFTFRQSASVTDGSSIEAVKKSILRETLFIDGVSVNVAAQVVNYEEYQTSALYVSSSDNRFLPFPLSCRVAVHFFHPELSYLYLRKGSDDKRQIYSWFQIQENDEVVKSPRQHENSVRDEFRGLAFYRV